MRRRKAQQTGSSAALLLAIIAAMILLYTLFIPPADRAKLLEETNDIDDDAVSDLAGKVLLKEDPGRLDLIKKQELEHRFSSFELVSYTEASVIKEFNSIYVEKGAFSEKTQNLRFDLEEVDNTENVLLSFNTKDASGRLIIKLNGNIIYEQKIKEGTSSPIEIPKEYLANSNFLELSVSSPGILFFLKNKYSLENVKVFGDITDDTGLENTQSFFVTNVERANLEKATLTFMVDCNDDKKGFLSVSINNQNVFSGVADCYVPVKVEMAPEKLISGENQVKFSADKGSYVISQSKLTTNLKDEIYQTYYFEVNDEEYEFLEDDKIDINMSLIFVTSRDFQDIEVEINGRKFSIDNKERIYSEVIDPYIREGNNAISLRPLDGTVEIVELKLFIVDVDEDDE